MGVQEKLLRAVGTVAAFTAVFDVRRSEEHPGEIDSVRVGRVPVFWRDGKGRPVLFRIPFPRWIRGPRD